MSLMTMALGHRALVLMALCAVLCLAGGCAGRQHEIAGIDETTSIERPARPLAEEETVTDRVGEVGIVALIVGVTIGGILLPILLL